MNKKQEVKVTNGGWRQVQWLLLDIKHAWENAAGIQGRESYLYTGVLSKYFMAGVN